MGQAVRVGRQILLLLSRVNHHCPVLPGIVAIVDTITNEGSLPTPGSLTRGRAGQGSNVVTFNTGGERAQRIATGRHDFRTRCCVGLRGAPSFGNVAQWFAGLLTFAAVFVALFKTGMSAVATGEYCGHRLGPRQPDCVELNLNVLADINPFSIDELGEAIRRNADSCVGRAPSGHDLLETL